VQFRCNLGILHMGFVSLIKFICLRGLNAPNNTLNSLTSFAGTPIRGAASPIMPHVYAPLSLKLCAIFAPLRLATWSIIDMESLTCEKEFEKDVVL
jgi:hypothetical protein